MRSAFKKLILLSILSFVLSGNAFADDYSDYIMEGNLNYKNKDYKKAAKAYENAVKLANDNVNAYYNLGLTYRHLKDFHSSISSFNKFLSGATDKKMITAAKKLLTQMENDLGKPTTAGRLKHYEVWEGWILIDGDVVVPKDMVLTIKPGSLVMFSPLTSRYDAKIPYLKGEETSNFASLIIHGSLIVEGEKDNEVLFANSFEDVTTKKIGLWGGIIFDGSDSSLVQYAKIERAVNGIVIKSKPDLTLSNNVFMKNDLSIKVIDDSPVSIENNIFYRNETGIEFSDKSIANVIYSNFTKNNYAIKVLDKSTPKLSNNTFDDNNCSICTYEESNPSIFDSTFLNGKFAISMTGNSKASISYNNFKKNKIGVNSVHNSKPKIEENTFSGQVISGINAIDNSMAFIRGNTFIKNKTAIIKVISVQENNNKFDSNTEDVKEME